MTDYVIYHVDKEMLLYEQWERDASGNLLACTFVWNGQVDEYMEDVPLYTIKGNVIDDLIKDIREGEYDASTAMLFLARTCTWTDVMFVPIIPSPDYYFSANGIEDFSAIKPDFVRGFFI